MRTGCSGGANETSQNNWDNLTFDGGFGGTGDAVPLGWTPDATYIAGGSFDSTGEAVWGGDYSILGDGVTATRGLITQSAVSDYLGAPSTAGQYGIFGARESAHDGRADAGYAARPYLQRVSWNFHDRNFGARRANYGLRVDRIHCADYSYTRLHDDSLGSAAARVCGRDADSRRRIFGGQHRDFSHRAAV